MEHPNVAQGPPWKWWNGGPTVHNIKYEHVLSKNNSKPVYEIIISTLALKQTQDAKNQIDLIQSNGVWDDYKKITNPYEYVFLSLNLSHLFSNFYAHKKIIQRVLNRLKEFNK